MQKEAAPDISKETAELEQLICEHAVQKKLKAVVLPRMRELIDRGADINHVTRKRRIVGNQFANESSTLLCEAVAGGSMPIVHLLANQEGIDIDKSNMHGQTPFHIALLRGDEQLARFLLSKGADPRQRSDIGDSLSIVGQSADGDKKTALLKLLKAHGMEPVSEPKKRPRYGVLPSGIPDMSYTPPRQLGRMEVVINGATPTSERLSPREAGELVRDVVRTVADDLKTTPSTLVARLSQLPPPSPEADAAKHAPAKPGIMKNSGKSVPTKPLNEALLRTLGLDPEQLRADLDKQHPFQR